jgi:putative chitinase
VNFPVPCSVISAILGPCGPPTNVANNWPLVEAALDARSIYTPLCAVAAIVTISVETPWFRPIKLRARRCYLENLYENRKDLGNDQPGDGVKFLGRGFIPIIGRRSYEYFGKQIGMDLAGNPDLALDPAIAAAILAVSFKDRGVHRSANQQNWEMVRRRMNPAANAWTRFFDAVSKLVAASNNPPPPAFAEPEEVEGLGQ